MYPDYYPPANATVFLPDIRAPDVDSDRTLPEVPFHHLAHCINSIRESLMCSVDITPNILYFDERVNKTVPAFDVFHECGDFNAIREWGLSHHLAGGFDASVHVSASP